MCVCVCVCLRGDRLLNQRTDWHLLNSNFDALSNFLSKVLQQLARIHSEFERKVAALALRAYYRIRFIESAASASYSGSHIESTRASMGLYLYADRHHSGIVLNGARNGRIGPVRSVCTGTRARPGPARPGCSLSMAHSCIDRSRSTDRF